MLDFSLETPTRRLIQVDSYPILIFDITLGAEQHLLSLQKRLSQAPNFFKTAPLMLLIEGEETQDAADKILEIFSFLISYIARPAGFLGAPWVEKIAHFLDMPYWPYQPAHNRQDCAKIIDTPLRAGQSFYHHGDVLLMAPAHQDSEILASGHIHCYAPAKGRLLAGVKGSKEAKIFGQIQQAQLVSIAGIFEKNLSKKNYKSSLMIGLKNDQLQIKELNYDC